MKKFMLAAFAALTMLCSTAFAQNDAGTQNGGNQNQRGRMREMNEELKAKLNLTADQQKKLQEIRQRNRKAMEDKMASMPNASEDERRQMRKDQMKQADQDIMAILTPDQQKIYQTEMDKRRSEFRGKGRPDGSTPPPPANPAPAPGN